jgi:peroxiredoxin family protein
MDDFAKAPFTRSTQNGMICAKAEKIQGTWKILSAHSIGTAAFASGKVAFIFLGFWLLGALNATHLCASR